MSHQYSTFFVDGLSFGVEVRKVQKVLRYQELTSVPIAHPAIRGLINPPLRSGFGWRWWLGPSLTFGVRLAWLCGRLREKRSRRLLLPPV